MKSMETIYMRKKSSPVLIQFTPDEDPHFCNVELIKAKTGEVKCTHYILTSDVPQWVSMYERDGFCPVDMTPELKELFN